MEYVTLVLNIIKTIQELAPIAIQTYEDAQKFVVPLFRSVSGGAAPTSEEAAAIDKGIREMSAELQAMKRPE